MEKNLILAIVLSVAVLVVYNIFFMPKPSPPPDRPEKTPKIQPEEKLAQPSSFEGERVTIENSNLKITVNTKGAFLTSIYLKNKKKELLTEGAIGLYPGREVKEVDFSAVNFTIKEKEEGKLVLVWEDTEKNISVTNTISLEQQGYHILFATFLDSPKQFSYRFILPAKIGEKEEEERIVLYDSKLYREKKEGVRSEYDSKVRWMGVREKKDFFLALIPLDKIQRGFFARDYFGFSAEKNRSGWLIYAGPQSYTYLRLANNLVKKITGEDMHLMDAAEIGIWGYLSVGLQKLLIFLYSFTGSYGIAIILLTIIIYGILSPLTFKQFESMQKMQLIQPELKKIQKKFKNDPRRMQAEIMKVYGKYKINPLAGCLPMVIQLPIIFILYRALLDFPFAENPTFLWIKNLGKPDIPLLLALAGCMFLQQRISQKMQKSVDETGITKIMQFFPFFLIIILWSLPSGVMLYWFTSTLISILQQFFIRKKSAEISLAET